VSEPSRSAEPELSSEGAAAEERRSGAALKEKKRGLPGRVRMRHDHHFVDELAKRSEPAIGRMLAIGEIEPDPNQPRESMGALDELVSSIREKGVLEPILVRRSPDRAGATYRIISGERRYRASMEAGLLELPAIEMEVTEQEALEIALIENLQRKDLTPFEEAEGYRALAEVHGYTHEQIASSVAKSRPSITESLSLLQMPPRVRDAVHALGIQAKSVLLEVMKAPSEAEMVRLLERVASLGLNRDDLRREVRRSASRGRGGSRRRKPYVFRFQAPDKRYAFSLTFRQSAVQPEDLVSALEEILAQLRAMERDEDSAAVTGGRRRAKPPRS
jgi:ParB family chromosome partitioning protein